MTEKDWDKLAAVYGDQVCDIFAHDRMRVVEAWLKRERLLDRGRTVLDVGCGVGSFFKCYGRRFGARTGTDHSQRMLEIAARVCRRQPGITWRQADVTRMPKDLAGTADLVVCSNVITFVSLPECRRALREVVRCARPGGRVLLVQPALESHDAVVAVETGRKPPRRRAMAVVRRDDRRQRFFSGAGAAAFAAGAGLSGVTVAKVWYPWRDEGITAPPRGHELPWDWMVAGRCA